MPNLLGTAPNQIGTNADHGSMAFQDQKAVVIEGGVVQADLTGNSWNQNTDTSTVQPTLRLDFDKMFALDPRITFGRASTGSYYDGKTFAVAEQNAFINSQDFNKTGWSTASASVISGAMIAPDGTLTATKVCAAAANTGHALTQATTSMSATPSQVTFSIHAKAGEYTKVSLNDGADARYGVTVDLSNGTVISAALGSVTPTVVVSSFGGGWYRIAITCALRVSTFKPSVIGYPDAGATINGYGATFTGDGASGIFIWGAQLEQRSAVSAYTPTTSASITNYIPQLMTAAANQARFDFDPITGECKGLLVEGQRVNLLTYSAAFSTNWVLSTGTKSTIGIAPDGTLAAVLVVPPASSANVSLYQSATVTAQAYTNSIYAKASGYGWIGLGFGGGAISDGAFFDLVNGVVGAVAASTTATITPVGNGWYRCSVTRTLSAGTGYLQVEPHSGNSQSGNWSSNGYYGVLIWGAQLEAGSFATSYIPTTSAQVTRSADLPWVQNLSSQNILNSNEMTLLAEMTVYNPSAAVTSNEFWFGLFLNTGSSYVSILYRLFQTLANGNTAPTGTYAVGAHKLVIASDALGRYMAQNGVLQTPNIGSIPPLSTAVYIRIGGGDATFHIRRLTYFPKRLTNAELVEMTQ